MRTVHAATYIKYIHGSFFLCTTMRSVILCIILEDAREIAVYNLASVEAKSLKIPLAVC